MSAQGKGTSDSEGVLLAARLGQLLVRRTRLLATGAVVGGACAALWLAFQAPTYRAEATLLLSDDEAGGGILGDLAALTRAPESTSEMEVLRSRTIAEAVVAPPEPGSAISVPRDAEGLRLGLTTLVEDESLRPLNRVFGTVFGAPPSPAGTTPRLFARAEPDFALAAKSCVRVDFVDRDRVRLSGERIAARFGLGGSEPVEETFTAGVPLEYGGMRIRLYPDGDLTGRSYVLECLPRHDAIEHVMQNTRVVETDRNSGVLRLTFEDSDPHRAAEIANALAKNYLARNQAQGEKRASQTVDFIAEQLDEQLEALEAAELEVVELQRDNPTSVDVTETARAIIEELSGLEVQLVQLRIAERGLSEAVDLLGAGDLGSLSRLGPELADPITASYLERIAALTAESELLARPDAGPYKGLLQARLVELETERDAVELKAATLRGLLERLEEGDDSVLGGLVSTADAGKNDPILTALVEEWSRHDEVVRGLETEFTDALPDLANARERRAEVRARIAGVLAGRVASLEEQAAGYGEILERRRSEVGALPEEERGRILEAIESLTERTLTHLESRLAGLATQGQSLQREIDEISRTLVELPEDERLLADPMRRLEAHSEIVKLLLSRQKEAEITRAATVPTAEFIDTAVPPRKPVGPSVPIALIAGTLLGACVAAGFALVREAMDGSVFTAADLEDATGLPVFGSIPDFRRGKLRVRGAGDEFLALRDDPEGPVAEAYRAIRSNLKFALSADEDLKVLGFTSCVQGEGKSVTNVNMALAFAMAEKRVLLVDADMRRPSTHRYVGCDLEPGLSEVLEGKTTWRDVAKVGPHENLTLITAGRQPRAPGDLLTSQRARDLIAELRGEFDLVVFDVPPALAVADIECLASHLDAVLLLTRSSRLSGEMIGHAVRKLRQVGANLLGAVLNAASTTRVGRGYGEGYGYGYGYEYGGTYGDRPAA